MDSLRRKVVKAGGGLGLMGVLSAAGLIAPGEASAAWNSAAFEAKSMEEALLALGAMGPEDSADIVFSAPEIAENGAAVPLSVVSALPGVEAMAILVEQNPNPLAASFMLPAGTEAWLQTRVKMAQSSDVYALLKREGQFLMSKRTIIVVLGGCGG